MKKVVLFLLIAAASFSCKRNKEITEDGKNEVGQYPLNCYNKIKDLDETGIDCGGSCEPCSAGAAAVPTCTPNQNSMVVNNVTYTANAGGVSSGTYYIVNGIYNSTSDYKITLKAAPDQTKVYSIVSATPDQDNQVAMQIEYNLNPVFLTGGKIYFTNNGTSYTAVVCNGVGQLSGVTVNVKGSFNFQ